MLISEQIENIVDNLGLERQTNQCRKGYAKLMNGDLSSFENYNGAELVQAVIDEFKIINSPINPMYQLRVWFGNDSTHNGSLLTVCRIAKQQTKAGMTMVVWLNNEPYAAFTRGRVSFKFYNQSVIKFFQ